MGHVYRAYDAATDRVVALRVLPKAVRIVGEVLEGAAKPVGSDAEGVIVLEDQHDSDTKVVRLPAQGRRPRSRR